MSRHVSSRSVVHVHVGEGLVLPIHIHIAHAHLAAFRARSGALFHRLLDSVRAGMHDMVDSIATSSDGAASSSDTSSKRSLAKQSTNLRCDADVAFTYSFVQKNPDYILTAFSSSSNHAEPTAVSAALNSAQDNSTLGFEQRPSEIHKGFSDSVCRAFVLSQHYLALHAVPAAAQAELAAMAGAMGGEVDASSGKVGTRANDPEGSMLISQFFAPASRKRKVAASSSVSSAAADLDAASATFD